MSKDNHVKNDVLERYSSRKIEWTRMTCKLSNVWRVSSLQMDGCLSVGTLGERGDQNCINLNGDSFSWDKTCSFQNFWLQIKSSRILVWRQVFEIWDFLLLNLGTVPVFNVLQFWATIKSIYVIIWKKMTRKLIDK